MVLVHRVLAVPHEAKLAFIACKVNLLNPSLCSCITTKGGNKKRKKKY